MTLAALRRFGIAAEPLPDGWAIPGGQRYRSPGAVRAEGDWSNAAFWLAAGALSRPVTVTGLQAESGQGDRVILEYLRRFGAEVEQNADAVTVRPAPLRGCSLDVRSTPDLAPPLALLAACAAGTTRITGAARLRYKESDRLASIAAALRALGADVRDLPDGLEIAGGRLTDGMVDACGDHRIAMAGRDRLGTLRCAAARGGMCGKIGPAFLADACRTAERNGGEQMSSSFGTVLKLQLFGESHGPAVGMCLDGFPAGFRPDLTALQTFLDRRAPGRSALTSAAARPDRPEFLSGLADGLTCGAPLTAVLPNGDAHPGGLCRAGGYAPSVARGLPRRRKISRRTGRLGRRAFLRRLTAPLCVAGGLCLQLLAAQGVEIFAHIAQIGSIPDRAFDPLAPERPGSGFPVLDAAAGEAMRAEIAAAAAAGDSVGGVVECAVTGPARRSRRADVRRAGKPAGAGAVCHPRREGRGVRQRLCGRSPARQ